MKNRTILLAILTIILLQTGVVFAQNAPTAVLELKQSVVANGGGASAGGNFSLDSTTGQALAGNLLQGGTFTTLSGFQAGIPILPPQTGVSISGQIKNGGVALSGVTVALGGSFNTSTTTDADGNYTFGNLPLGADYTVTPSRAGFVFDPAAANFTNLSASRTANFAATQCAYSLNPNGTNAPANGMSGTFALTTSAGCPWTAVPNNNWITVTAGNSGIGSATISFTIAANAGAPRTGSITVGGQNFIITESGLSSGVSGAVSYGVTPANQAVKFVPGVLLSATGATTASTNTDALGSYLLDNLVSGGQYSVMPSKTGGVNGITAFDATLVLRCVAAGAGCALSNNQRLAADANNNGTISAFDATQILRFVAAGGATINTGQVGNWKFTPAPRSYAAVSGLVPNENYEAVIIGEVNGNWTAPTSFAAAEADNSSAAQPQPIEVSLPEKIMGAKDTIVVVPVAFANNGNKSLSAYNFVVSFDPSILEPDATAVDAIETASAGMNIVADADTPGKIGVAAAGAVGKINASKTLLKLRFKVVGAWRETTKLTFVQNSEAGKSVFEDNEGNAETPRTADGSLTVAVSSPVGNNGIVAGRVTTADGRGIRNVLVRLTDEDGEIKTVVTEAFGNYRFVNVSVNRSYTISVAAKKYNFSQSSQTRLIVGETNDVDFTADN